VPDVTRVLQDAIEEEAKIAARAKVNSRKEIDALKDDGRYVLEVY
jgi:sulfite reductase (NADPH) flavoprotein alpha-component